MTVSACICAYCHRTDWLCPINHNNCTMWSLLRRERYMAILLTSAKNKQISLFVFGGMITWILIYWRKVHVNFSLLEEGTREFRFLEEGTRKFWFIRGRYTWILVYWRKVHVNFGLLEEGTREFWFIGGRCTWILVYWRKVHVNFGLLEEDTLEFWFIGERYTWILVYWRKVHVNFGLLEKGTSEICWWSRYGSWNGLHLSVCTDFLASIFTEYTFISLFFRVVFSIEWPSQMWRHSRVKAGYVRSHSYRYPK